MRILKKVIFCKQKEKNPTGEKIEGIKMNCARYGTSRPEHKHARYAELDPEDEFDGTGELLCRNSPGVLPEEDQSAR